MRPEYADGFDESLSHQTKHEITSETVVETKRLGVETEVFKLRQWPFFDHEL